MAQLGPGKRTLVETIQFAGVVGATVADRGAIAGAAPSGGAPLPEPPS